MHHIITAAERISEDEFKLISEAGNAYYYKIITPTAKEDKDWKQYVLDGQKVLLNWIEYQADKPPASIYWNYEKRAMLEVAIPKHSFRNLTTFGSEINPFELKDSEESWVVDPACPFERKFEWPRKQ